MPTKDDPFHAFLAIATDLLAQCEAQHRSAIRLEAAVRQLSRAAKDRATVVPPIELVREQLRVMRELFEVERALLADLEQQLSGASH